MTDILNQIDESIARNEARFDPFGPAPLPEPVKSGIEEEAVEVEAVVEAPAPASVGIAAAFREIYAERASVEALRPSTAHLRGCCTCPMTDVTAIGNDGGEGIRTFVQGYDPDCPVCPAPAAPLVDEPVEPDPDLPRWPRDEHGRLRSIPRLVGRDTVDLAEHIDAGNGMRFHSIGTGDQEREVPCDCPKPAPWWRRYLPGGTR